MKKENNNENRMDKNHLWKSIVHLTKQKKNKIKIKSGLTKV